MQLQYMYSPMNDIFARFDVGYLEEMFGGIGGEVLYRPFKKIILWDFHYIKLNKEDTNKDSVLKIMRQLLVT